VTRRQPPDLESGGSGRHDRVLRRERAQRLLIVGLDNREAAGVLVGQDRSENHHVATAIVMVAPAVEVDEMLSPLGDDAQDLVRLTLADRETAALEASLGAAPPGSP
jgi:hypothetical protein